MKEKLDILRKDRFLELRSWAGLSEMPGTHGLIITNDRMHALEELPSTCAKFILEANPQFEQLIEISTHSLVSILKAYPHK